MREIIVPGKGIFTEVKIDVKKTSPDISIIRGED
jgi:hypothetical protein